MKAGFYPKLAFDGIRKNRRMYLPYILTCIGMVMMYYIIVFLQNNDAIRSMRGGETIQGMMELGTWVIAIFACIFLFYTNSFLIRRRKKEFGLYNILGMGKGNIGFILFWEALIISGISLGAGLFAGIVFSKLAELGLVNVLSGSVNYSFSVSPAAIAMTVMVFGVIFLLLFLNSLRQVKFANAISLLRSENVGEKPPKGNWLVGILGVLMLGAAYGLAVTIQNPVSALLVFFLAVVLVILGTYLVMIAGSVLFCRILQKRKNYYYKANHFVSVSSMVYRMKRNGAGLASICILATMVLVMISSTTSLYAGEEDSINARYPREINTSFQWNDVEEMTGEAVGAIRNEMLRIVRSYDADPANIHEYRSASVAGLLMEDTVETDVSKIEQFHLDTYSNVYQIYIIPIEDYNALMGTDETLEEDEALLYFYRDSYRYEKDTLSFRNGRSFRIKKIVDDFAGSGEAAMAIVPTIVIFVPDLKTAIEGIDELADYNGNRMVTLRWSYNFDTGLERKDQDALYAAIRENFRAPDANETYGYYAFSVQGREMEREDFYSIFGSLFYLGIVLSAVFILAAVLIIYYKQISEGYEDQARFEIMQKIGMTKREIRKSINSQLLTVFFLPLVGAGMHLAFAFPIIRKLLLLFNLNNVVLFAVTTVISFVVFALFYCLVYRITSNAYYNIVSGARE